MAKDIKPITEIKQKGNDFVVTSKTPGKTVTNTFTIGKESDITTMDGKKLKVCTLSLLLICMSHHYFFLYMIWTVSSSDLQCIVNMEGGKMVCNTGKFCHIQELKGGEMVEVRTLQELTHSISPWCIVH